MLQAMSIDKWSLLTNAITLLVITATAYLVHCVVPFAFLLVPVLGVLR
jgi:hypothetical protein